MSAYFGEFNVSERVIIENELAFAFPTNMPIVPGHLLICPKRVVTRYEDLSEEEKSSIERLRIQLKMALERLFGAEGFNYAWNEAEVAGQSIAHFHLHIVPRKKGDAGIYTYEPREFLYRPGTRSATPEEELADIARTIRSAL